MWLNVKLNLSVAGVNLLPVSTIRAARHRKFLITLVTVSCFLLNEVSDLFRQSFS